MEGNDKLYRVEFAIDVTAGTPNEACQIAWAHLTQPDALLPIGDVTTLTEGEKSGWDGDCERVDLQELAETAAWAAKAPH